MSNYKRASLPGVAGMVPLKRSILSTLQATNMNETKPTLPAEILVTILDYLPVSDQMRFARASRRLREMVYDDTRWVARLKSLGCWDDVEARRRFDEAVKRKRATIDRGRVNGGVAPVAPATQTNTTIFDATQEEERQKKRAEETAKSRKRNTVDGFETLSLNATQSKSPSEDPAAALDVLKNARSIRGYARQEYGKIYGALAPFYFDLARAESHTDPVLFKVFKDPERQAQMLANLQTFAKSDWSEGWLERGDKLRRMLGIFESAVLREFERGYEFGDVDGSMKRYAHVMHTLNGGHAAVEVFIAKHAIFDDRAVLANPIDCVNQAPRDSITLEPSRLFFDTLSRKLREQTPVITRTFPNPAAVFWTLVDRISEDIITEYVTPLLYDTHERNVLSYLKAVSGLFEQCMVFVRSLEPPPDSDETVEKHAKEIGLRVFEPHIDLYLEEELEYFAKYAERQVGNWEQRLSEQDASAESFYMANFNRRADKNDFLSSFKKVVMMPVTALPSPFASSKPASPGLNGSSNRPASIAGTPGISRTSSPAHGSALELKRHSLPLEVPADELKAKAALMASRLAGIKTLFSIEVALDLVQTAKTSLGRASKFVSLGGQAGEEAREQCEAIFVKLLEILGHSHVKSGFKKAVDHLAHYNPRDVSDHNQAGVAPLVTFIELVNVGDLISQMIDVFYEQQLAATKIADRNDFLDPAGIAKKKFEQMLDESVAAGLNKGIDVLMDEVEYMSATTQLPTDYNPPPAELGGASESADIGPTQTAKRIRELVASHTSMLVGTTEKNMLDVFNGEIGLRLFTAICKHLKRQRISTEGAIKLIADMNLYFDYIRTLKNPDLQAYFKALRELSQIYLIDAKHAKEMATIIADGDRFGGIFRAEEVYEFAERRADWYQVKRDVERAMYGLECAVM